MVIIQTKDIEKRFEDTLQRRKVLDLIDKISSQLLVTKVLSRISDYAEAIAILDGVHYHEYYTVLVKAPITNPMISDVDKDTLKHVIEEFDDMSFDDAIQRLFNVYAKRLGDIIDYDWWDQLSRHCIEECIDHNTVIPSWAYWGVL